MKLETCILYDMHHDDGEDLGILLSLDDKVRLVYNLLQRTAKIIVFDREAFEYNVAKEFINISDKYDSNKARRIFKILLRNSNEIRMQREKKL